MDSMFGADDKMSMLTSLSISDFANARNRLYAHLLTYFPKHMKQPDESLIDTMRIVWECLLLNNVL